MLPLRSKKAIILLICLSSIACANKLANLATIGKEVGKAAVQLQQNEIEDFNAGKISKLVHRETQEKFEHLGLSIKAMNSAISVTSLVGVRAAISDIQLTISSFSTMITSSQRLQVWITIINGFIATMVALI